MSDCPSVEDGDCDRSMRDVLKFSLRDVLYDTVHARINLWTFILVLNFFFMCLSTVL